MRLGRSPDSRHPLRPFNSRSGSRSALCYNAGPGRAARDPRERAIHLLQTLTTLDWTRMGLSIALLVLSLGLHEAAHAWVALRCGDSTGRDLGRISLNPLVHVDPFMTLVLPAILYVTSGFVFGGAKPVPVNFYNLRHPYRDMALVALAGPLTNLLLAAVFFLLFKVVVLDAELWPTGALGSQVLLSAVTFNLLLAAFNLIPIPPLDGSRVMAWLLPEGLREGYRRLEGLGMVLILLLVVFVAPFQDFLRASMNALFRMVTWIVTLGGTW